MRYLPCELGKNMIRLGKTGEGNALRMEFDCAKWLEEFPNALIRLFVRTPGGMEYYPAIGSEGTDRVWIVDNEKATKEPGNGVIELLLIDEKTATTIKSATGYTTVLYSPSAGLETAENEPGYVRYDTAQVLTEEQKAQARANIGAGTGSGTGDREDGEDGGYYAPSVDENGNLTWTPSKSDMSAVSGANIKGPAGKDGRGIVSNERTSGDGSPGTVDTYTITYTDGTTSTYTVTNGKDGQDGSGGGSGAAIDDETPSENTTYSSEKIEAEFTKLDEAKVNKSDISLGFGADGKLYIMISGVAYGNGVSLSGTIEPSEDGVVFMADFSGASPSPAQFYSWEGRDYDGAICDALENIQCADGVATLTSVYDADKGKWIRQMMTTGGFFESDDFTCKFKAKFCGLAGSWNNVITYGTGTHWTSGTYSDGVKWPAGGEIDAFEQAGGYDDTPNHFTPLVHYGAGSQASYYPNTHLTVGPGVKADLPVDEWADFEFSLKNGVITYSMNGEVIATQDASDLTVDNDYMVEYHPFMKPHAFYIDGSCASGSSSIDTANVYTFEVSDFKVIQDSVVECSGLVIYPQMWPQGTELTFPVGAEIYLDRIYTPSNTSNKACTWASSDPTVATVVQGYVKVLKVGSTTITATCGSATAEYVLTAAEEASVPCAKIASDSGEGIMVPAGSSQDITAYVYPRYTTESVTWESSDDDIATVTDGTVTGVTAGDVTITARCGNKTTTIPVAVNAANTPYISYDFEEAFAANYYAPATAENKTVTLVNKGSAGSVFDATCTAATGTYDLDGNYDADGFINSYNFTTAALEEAINLKQTSTFVWTAKEVITETGRPTFLLNGSNGNIMPSLSGTTLKYGNVTKYDVTYTGNDKIVAHCDGSKAYAYQNGELKASGTAGYTTNAFSYFNFSGLTGRDVTKLEVYVGNAFTEAELIAMSTPE